MSRVDPTGDDAVFQSTARRDEFWSAINDVMASFPEVSRIPSVCFTDEDKDNAGNYFDVDAPVMIDGMVLIFSLRNLQGFEQMVISDPTQQSEFVTKGLIASAGEFS